MPGASLSALRGIERERLEALDLVDMKFNYLVGSDRFDTAAPEFLRKQVGLRRFADEPEDFASRQGVNLDNFVFLVDADAVFLRPLRLLVGLRVCPETSGRIAKFSEHEAN
jgi:hypothetical protein